MYRRIVAAGHARAVVAPALIPRKPGERVKTDRRDCVSLARLDRVGELTAVWVPGPEQEAMRDLSRAREDLKTLDKQTRQRLSAFLLRQGRIFSGKQRWTQAHFRWIELEEINSPVQQIVLEEYVARRDERGDTGYRRRDPTKQARFRAGQTPGRQAVALVARSAFPERIIPLHCFSVSPSGSNRLSRCLRGHFNWC